MWVRFGGRGAYAYTSIHVIRTTTLKNKMYQHRCVSMSFFLVREAGRSVGQYDWEYSSTGMNFLSNGGFASWT